MRPSAVPNSDVNSDVNTGRQLRRQHGRQHRRQLGRQLCRQLRRQFGCQHGRQLRRQLSLLEIERRIPKQKTECSSYANCPLNPHEISPPMLLSTHSMEPMCQDSEWSINQRNPSQKCPPPARLSAVLKSMNPPKMVLPSTHSM